MVVPIIFCLLFFACFHVNMHETKTMEEVIVTFKGNAKDPNQAAILESLVKDYGKVVDEEKKKLKPNEEKLLNGINKQFLNGLDALVKGAATKTPRTFLIGSLNVATALVSSFGIQGFLAGRIMSVLAKALSIYGDISSVSGGNPTELALKDFQISNLELDVAGIKEYFENLVDPVVTDDSSSTDSLDSIKYTETEAKQVIRNAQENLHLYGKLHHLISKYCNNEANDKEIKQCLATTKIYCKLSQIHVAYLQTSIKRIDASKDFKDNGDKYKRMIARFIAKRNQRDKEMLRFLTDPMKNFDKTEIIFELYSKQDEYSSIVSHLLAISEADSDFFKNDTVVVCKETRLKGMCREVKAEFHGITFSDNRVAYDPNKEHSYTVTYGKTIELEEWVWTKSIFIPPKVSITLYATKKVFNQEAGAKVRGPFRGLSVYSSDEKLNLKGVQITTVTDDRNDYVIICTDKKDKADRWCDTVSDSQLLRNLNGVNLGRRELSSITVPDNFDVELVAMDGTVIQIFGPFVMKNMKACRQVWKTLRIKKVNLITDDNKEDSGKSKKPQNSNDGDDANTIMVEVGTEKKTEEEMMKLKRGDSMIKVCTEKNLKGFCRQVNSDEFKQTGSLLRLPKLQRLRHGCKVDIESVEIPGGVKVTVIEKFLSGPSYLKSRFGPYYGPTTLNKLHRASKYRFVIEDANDKKTTDVINTNEDGEPVSDDGDETNGGSNNNSGTSEKNVNSQSDSSKPISEKSNTSRFMHSQSEHHNKGDPINNAEEPNSKSAILASDIIEQSDTNERQEASRSKFVNEDEKKNGTTITMGVA